MFCTWSGVLEFEVFIAELHSVDGLAAGAVVVGEVAALKSYLTFRLGLRF